MAPINKSKKLILTVGIVMGILAGIFAISKSVNLFGKDRLNGLNSLQYGWQPDQTYQYGFSYTALGWASMPVAKKSGACETSPHEPIESVAAGQLSIRRLHDSQENFINLLYELKEIKASGSLNHLPLSLNSLKSGMKFYVTMTRRGEIKKIAFSSDSEIAERAMIRAILALSQVVLSDKAALSWVTSEETPSGAVEAHYRGEDDGNLFNFNKSIQSKKHRERQISGEFSGNFDRSLKIPTEISGKNTSLVLWSGCQIGEEHTTFSWRYMGKKLQTPNIIAEMPQKDLITSDLGGSDEFAKSRRDGLRVKLGSDTTTTLLAKLHENADGSLKETQEIYLKLVALLTLFPDEAGQVGAELNTFSPKIMAFRTIATALSKVGSAEAQRALRDQIEGFSENEEAALTLLPHLGMTVKPTIETEGFIRRLAHGEATPRVIDTATLLLGSVAHSVRSDEQERAVNIVKELATALETAKDADKRKLLIMAMGNGGLGEQFKYVANDLTARDALLRSGAASSLRYVDTYEARDALLNLAQSDPDTRVRATALNSLSYTSGDSSTLGAYTTLLTKEQDVVVLRELLHNIALMAEDNPEAKKLLKEFIGKCAHPDLCLYVKGLFSAIDG